MALEEADLAKIAELIAAANAKQLEETKKLVVGEVGKSTKALQKDLDGKLEASKTETAKTLEELKVAEPPPAPAATGADPVLKIEDQPAFKRLQAEVEASKLKAVEQSKRAEEAEAKRKQDQMVSTVRDSLLASGADPERVAIAMSHLTAKGTIKLNDAGEAVFTIEEKWGPEDLPASTGAKRWLETTEGKFFVPPSGRQGTGDGIQRPGVTQPAGNAPRVNGKVDWSALGQRMNMGVLEGSQGD